MIRKDLNRIKAINFLKDSDPTLGKFLSFFEEKQFYIQNDYNKKSEFLSLVRIIIGQQLSISAAGSIYSKFIKKFGEAINFLDINNESELLELGLSKTKTHTILTVSNLIKNRRINLLKISSLEEKEAKKILCDIKGIGPWTVENFLIFAGNNMNICPANDLGVKKGIKKIYNLTALPTDLEVYKIAEHWKPYRSLAVRYIWEIVDQDINFA